MKKKLALFFIIVSIINSKGQDVIIWPKDNMIFQRNASNSASFRVFFRLNPTVSYMEYRTTKKKVDDSGSRINDGPTSGWTNIVLPENGRDNCYGTLNLNGGFYEIQFRVNGDNNRIMTKNIGIGDIYVIAGQSNAAGYDDYHNVNLKNDLVFCFKPNETTENGVLHKRQHQNFTVETLNSIGANANSINNQTFGPNGKGKYYWHILGDKLVRDNNNNNNRKDVPVLFFNVAVEDSNIENWHNAGPKADDCGDATNIGTSATDIYNAIRYYIKPTGFRAVLWHQGEADAAIGDRTLPPPFPALPPPIDYLTMKAFYQSRLQNLINNIRGNFGSNVPWVISQTSLNNYILKYVENGMFKHGCKNGTNASTLGIIDAQAAVVNNNNVFSGPYSDDITLADRGGNVHFRSESSLNTMADRWFQKLNSSFVSSTNNYLVPNELPVIPYMSASNVEVEIQNVDGFNDTNHKLFKKNGNSFTDTNFPATYANGKASFNISGQQGEFFIRFQRLRGGNTYSNVASANFYLDSSGGCSVNTPSPTATTVTNSGSSTLTSNCGSNATNWYNVSSGGSVIGTGSTWDTPVITTTTVYYATCISGACESSRVSVTATVNTSGGGACLSSSSIPNGNYKIKLKSTGQYIRPNASNKIEQSTVDNSNIYNISTSGGWTTITNISNNQNLQSQGESQGSYIIQTSPSSDSHQKFLFQLDGTSYKIIPQNVNGWGWGLSLETYTGSGEYGLIRQYGFNGNNSLFDVCPSGGGGCTPNTPAPSANPNTINATSGTSVLSSGCGSNTTNWYNSASGGSLVGTGSPFTTLTISTTTIYYAACNNGSCESSRVGVTVSVNPPSGGSCVSSTTIPNGNYKIKLKSTGQYIRPNASNKMEQSTVDNSNIYNISTSGGWTTITNISNNQNLQSQGESPGSYIIQTSPSSDSHQKFLFQLDGTSYKIIPQNVNGWGWGLSLETYSGSGEYGLIRQYGFDGNNSLFDVCPSGSGGARLSFEKTEALVQKNESLIVPEKENNISKENIELFVIYPNPTSSIITLIVYSEKETTGEFNIYDIQGKTIKNTNKSLKSGSQEIKIDLGKQIEGRYFIKGIIDNKILTKPFVIQN